MQPIRVLGDPELLAFRRPPALEDFYVLSPYALRCAGGYEMLLRLVNRDEDASKKVSRIHHASSSDGLRFDVGAVVIAPGTADEPDGAGCEDPTVVGDGRSYTVFYSGYNALHNRSSMLRATGSTLTALRKAGTVFPPTDSYANQKEAAVVATSQGFRVFFEYARDDASHIGVADASSLAGPWSYAESPLEQRAGAFDSWHMSPSSAVRRADGTHVLFYNGSSKKTDWRISYAVLDETATVVLERPVTPLISAFGLEDGDTDIAFVASTPVDSSGNVWLYYTIADRKPYRSRVDLGPARM
jgi:beta-1,2-mannobiose phosphorylase / 1,2-beta-oligomannan phosphorylase